MVFVQKSMKVNTIKVLNFRTPKMLTKNQIRLKFKQKFLMSFHREICPKDADGMTNSVDPDQTAPLGTV